MNIYTLTHLWHAWRRWPRSFDWGTFAIMSTLMMISLLFVLSTTYRPACPYSIFFKKQLFGFITGLGIYFIISHCDYRSLQAWGTLLYSATLALLVATLCKGSMGLGAPRWLNLGFVKFQPSELPKLFFPPFFTSVVMYDRTRSWRSFIPLIMVIALSFLLIHKQPDLGTALIIGISGLVLLAAAGIGFRFFLILALTVAIAAPLIWHTLKPYQKQRILVFLGHGTAQKERYQIEQSYIAIGSGGLCGKGIFRGTQNMLQFLPESRTDFIFAIICEEWGLIGALCIIVLYVLLFLRWITLITTFHDTQAQLLAIGLIAPIIGATIINIGMVTGLLPIVGIPLPLMSYGITHSWITLASIGWLNSIIIQRA